MRYIDLETLLEKRESWGHRAELWKNETLKHDFREYFYNKCWYTEVPLIGQDAPIDHFRPKAEILPFEDLNYNRNLQACGYYWLTNEPVNYRLCCTYANRRTGEGGKGCFFPLADNSEYLTPEGHENETALLLDPCNREDVALITFVGNQVLSTSSEPFDEERVRVSASIYNMNDPYIKLERGKVWDEIDKTLAEYSSHDINQTACLRRLNDAIDKRTKFSACAIAAIMTLAPDDIKSQLNLIL